MMFKFKFIESELDTIQQDSGAAPQEQVSPAGEGHAETEQAPLRELSIEELVKALPPVLSYSPIHFHFPELSCKTKTGTFKPDDGDDCTAGCNHPWSRTNLTLVRRDLFDARFQLIAQEDAAEEPSGPSSGADAEATTAYRADIGVEDLKVKTTETSRESERAFVDHPSDLVPGVYEGGLKTWECAVDVVEYLETVVTRACGGPEWARSIRMLEVGCGTAIPTLYLLHELFSHPWKKEMPQRESAVIDTTIVLQDYNSLVLELVTFPNMLLTWYISPLAESFRERHPQEHGAFDVNAPGEVVVTPELLSAFRASLLEERIVLRFLAGSWGALINDRSSFDEHFDVVLTSETIYNSLNLTALIEVIGRATMGNMLYDSPRSRENDKRDLKCLSGMLSLESRPQRFGWPICLVAAKVLYFGVGGGVEELQRLVTARSGQVMTVLERKFGVGRRLMQIDWPHLLS